MGYSEPGRAEHNGFGGKKATKILRKLEMAAEREVADAHRKRTVSVEVKAEHDDFREVRFYKRGRHVEQYEVKEWFGLRRRKVEIVVFDDIVLVVAMKTQAEIGSRGCMAAPIPLPIPPTSKANHPSSTPDSAYNVPSSAGPRGDRDNAPPSPRVPRLPLRVISGH